MNDMSDLQLLYEELEIDPLDPIDVVVDEIKQTVEAINNLASEVNRKSRWLDHIYTNSRGKARAWAEMALVGDDVSILDTGKG